ncbi:hypothetical protein PR048_031034 [Dryococelus australis]|uniref:Uncharacterized protein n=1 Tax=Dryococelus australis TaxID=614101 RepID=A0ABQ9G452_9NEOP|nr:hypothetical protein PR048_031034 [Dryococelus australis]
MVDELQACSPPTNAIRVQFPGQFTPDFRMWGSCRTMPFGFSSRRCSILTSISLIGSQDLDRVSESAHLAVHSLRGPADQRHHVARFPHARIRSDPAGLKPERHTKIVMCEKCGELCRPAAVVHPSQVYLSIVTITSDITLSCAALPLQYILCPLYREQPCLGLATQTWAAASSPSQYCMILVKQRTGCRSGQFRQRRMTKYRVAATSSALCRQLKTLHPLSLPTPSNKNTSSASPRHDGRQPAAYDDAICATHISVAQHWTPALPIRLSYTTWGQDFRPGAPKCEASHCTALLDFALREVRVEKRRNARGWGKLEIPEKSRIVRHDSNNQKFRNRTQFDLVKGEARTSTEAKNSEFGDCALTHKLIGLLRMYPTLTYPKGIAQLPKSHGQQ